MTLGSHCYKGAEKGTSSGASFSPRALRTSRAALDSRRGIQGRSHVRTGITKRESGAGGAGLLVGRGRIERRNFQKVADLRTSAIDCVRRNLENAGGLERNFGDAEGAHELFDVNDFLFLAEENNIDREKHPDGVNAA